MRIFGLCIDTCIDTVHTSPMTTTQNIEATRTAKAAAVAALAKAAPRTRKAALLVLEAAEIDLDIAIRNHEQQIRASFAGLAEAEIQQLVRAA